MPRGFTEREKEMIRSALLEKGKQIFATYGVKKTSVEDLTRAAGISKGAFYLFYDSKEELFFDVIEQFEEDFRRQILSGAHLEGQTPAEQLGGLMRTAFSVWKQSPLMSNFSREEYEILLRKLPEEKVTAHLRSDDLFIEELVENLKGKGIQLREDPELISGLMKALFYVSLHEQEIGSNVYPQTMDLLIDLVVDHLVKT